MEGLASDLAEGEKEPKRKMMATQTKRSANGGKERTVILRVTKGGRKGKWKRMENAEILKGSG